MRAAFIYGYEPSGHASAARAIAAALGESHQTNFLNVSKDLHPVLGPAVAGIYLQLVQKAPALWEYLYDNSAAATAAAEFGRAYGALEGGKLRTWFAGPRPDVIVGTHAMSLAAAAAEKERGGIAARLAAVVTDFHAHRYWARPGVDLYLVPTEQASAALSADGVPADRIRVTGIPIHPRFSRAGRRESAKASLGLDSSRPLALVCGGSKGLGAMAGAVEALGTVSGLQVAAACGSNAALRHGLSSRRGGDRLVLDHIEAEPMRELLQAADFVVGKAGGLTMAEALAAGAIPVILEPLPGQEERNAEFLAAQGAGLRAGGAAEAADIVRGLWADPGRLSVVRARGRALARPEASQRAAEALLDLARK